MDFTLDSKTLHAAVAKHVADAILKDADFRRQLQAGLQQTLTNEYREAIRKKATEYVDHQIGSHTEGYYMEFCVRQALPASKIEDMTKAAIHRIVGDAVGSGIKARVSAVLRGIALAEPPSGEDK